MIEGIGEKETKIMITPESLTVRHEPSAKRFAVRIKNKIGYLSYEIRDNYTLDYAHVYVPPEYRRCVIAAKITKIAMEYARDKLLKVIPSCSYVASYLSKHTEYSDIIAEYD